jgi:hypothetical protein
MAENVMYMLCYVLQDMTKIYYVFFKYPDKPVYPNSAVHLIQMTVDIF